MLAPQPTRAANAVGTWTECDHTAGLVRLKVLDGDGRSHWFALGPDLALELSDRLRSKVHALEFKQAGGATYQG